MVGIMLKNSKIFYKKFSSLLKSHKCNPPYKIPPPVLEDGKCPRTSINRFLFLCGYEFLAFIILLLYLVYV